MAENQYNEDSIRSLDWKEHIRLRPGMYIGKLGNGSSAEDGIYILMKEVVDNCIDEFMMGNGKRIDINLVDNMVSVRDFGRGIPLGKVVDVVSKINTGAKYDSKVFQKSVGLNGVGTKAVNALSSYFMVRSFREAESMTAVFERGVLVSEKREKSDEKNGTYVEYTADTDIFKTHKYINEYIDNQMWNYVYLNAGLTINFNGNKYFSKNGLLDLLYRKTNEEEIKYPIIHLKDGDIEMAITHDNHYGEDYYSFVNGQNTTQGGTHVAALKEALVRTIRDFYGKNYEPTDIRASLVSAISVRIQEPVFESQTKTKLGSTEIAPGGASLKTEINQFVKSQLDNFLHKNAETAEALHRKIQQSERERKDMAGVRKIARERAKKASVHNKKLRDCRVHFTDEKKENRLETTLFITEGDSASGSITKARDVQTQAVFSLRGKPLNSFGLKKKIVYENEEFNLLQHALNIEESIDDLRYNKIVIATDADVDGMHIRLLILTFFLQFFPDLVRKGHVYILETPLFRVRNKKETLYCYTDQERFDAIRKLGKTAEITRFKGLGEISPDEFGGFIGEDIRLEPVLLTEDSSINKILEYYMGKNTMQRQEFIIDNLRLEIDEVEEEAALATASQKEEIEAV
ncbi:MAG: type IIA DNA topoisomerase subunit B [Bacteroidetes bacterium]|jgi:topoisomerase-4 subunit B|nr:type IIA DNA topoisomerase subunit B [Bacteroidota bacterium]